jgi:ribosomal protein L12E/L44/L45/RPP1/RPP2
VGRSSATAGSPQGAEAAAAKEEEEEEEEELARDGWTESNREGKG